MASARAVVDGAVRQKRGHFVRHGQAMHNIRAEALRHSGCTYQEFLDQMATDDAFDADLTSLGRKQAAELGSSLKSLGTLQGVQLVVSSPLSRAVDTADAVMPAAAG